MTEPTITAICHLCGRRETGSVIRLIALGWEHPAYEDASCYQCNDWDGRRRLQGASRC